MKVTVRRTRTGLLLAPTTAWARQNRIALDRAGDVPRSACVELHGQAEQDFLAKLDNATRYDIEQGWCLALAGDFIRPYFRS